jgi:biofilm PGA synthesis N-glycosyltransferase PgaC
MPDRTVRSRSLGYAIHPPAYVVITPVRDEAEHIGKTIDSMARQSILPQEWIIVDDGSTDQTAQIVDAAAHKYPWLYVVHRPNRGFRKSGGGVIQAFYDGYSAIRPGSWDFLVKLDGDLSFNADYFEKCFTYFACDPSLGVGGGTICVLKNGQLSVDAVGDPPFHVRGATKIYRRACWEKISPLVQTPGWDTIDEVKANMHGWTTQTFRDLKLIQLKGTGSADGEWRDLFKNGLGSYITGYHPVFMIARCVKRTFRKPFLLASAALWVGFCSGYLRRIPQVHDRVAIRYLRQQQLRRLLLRPSIYG